MNNAIAIDYETYRISEEAGLYPRPVCLSWYDGNNGDVIVGHDEMLQFMQQLLQKDVQIIAHNAQFEFGVTWTHFPELRDALRKSSYANRWECTKAYEQQLDNVREKCVYRYSLSDVVQRYFNEDISAEKKDPDAWRLRYSELDGIPKEEWPQRAIDYSLDDSIWSYKAQKEQVKLLRSLGVSNIEAISESVRAECWLNLMANIGMMVDMERALQLENEVKEKLLPNQKLLLEAGLCGYDKNGRIIKNQKIFREHVEQHIKEPSYTAKGAVAIDSENLDKYLVETGDKYIEAYLNIMKYEKIISTYTKNLKVPMIRTQYSAAKSTGRTSSSGSSLLPAVNIQQMPRAVKGVTWDVRNCFVPRPGYKICSIDYSGLELAATAHQLYVTYGHSAMRDIINGGDKPTDMHSKFAAKVKGCTYEQFVAHKKEPEYARIRQFVKAPHLGFPGGIGYDTMRKLMAKEGLAPKMVVLETSPYESYIKRAYRMAKKNVSEYVRIRRTGPKEWQLVYDELVKLKHDMFDLYPELGEFLKKTHLDGTTGESKWMKNEWDEWEEEPMYRYDIYGVSRDYSTYTAYCNGFLMQTPSAVGAKRAMCAIISKYLDDDRMNPLAFIHDEIVFEVREDCDWESVVADVSKIMIEEMQTVLSSVRITVEAEMMDYWMKAGNGWSKSYWKDEGGQELRYG